MIEALNELDLVCRRHRHRRRAGDPLLPGRDRQAQAAAFHAPRADVSRLRKDRRRRDRADHASRPPSTAAFDGREAVPHAHGHAHRAGGAARRAAGAAALGTLAEGLEAHAADVMPGIAERAGRQGLRPLRRRAGGGGLLSGGDGRPARRAPRRTRRSKDSRARLARAARRRWPRSRPSAAARSRRGWCCPSDRRCRQRGAAHRHLIGADRGAAHGGRRTPRPRGRARGRAAGRPAGRLQLGAGRGHGAPAPRQCPAQTLAAGQTVVLKLPNAQADAALEAAARVWRSAAHPRAWCCSARRRGCADGRWSDRADGGSVEIRARHRTHRGHRPGPGERDAQRPARARRWQAGMPACSCPMPAGRRPSAPGCVVHSAGEPLRAAPRAARRRLGRGAELARGVSTVTHHLHRRAALPC